MAKPSPRHTSHVQPDRGEAADSALPLVAPAPSDAKPIIRSENTRGRLWMALLIWAFVFGFLFIYLLIDLAISFFVRR